MSAYTGIFFNCDQCGKLGRGKACFGYTGNVAVKLPRDWWHDYGDPRSDNRSPVAQMCDECSAEYRQAKAQGGRAVLDYYDKLAREAGG